MHWSTEPFRAAYAALVSDADSLSEAEIIRILSPIKDDLRALLSAPPKSETSRQSLGKRVITIDGREVELNEAFVNVSVRVADELNLDELIAAHLVFYASEDSKCLGVDILESAISLFFVRRQYIIDMVRFGLYSLSSDQFSFLIGSSQRVEHIFLALKAVEQTMEDLSEKSKASQFMGFDQSPQFRLLIELQREYLVKEHDALGSVLHAYMTAAGSQENESGAALQILRHLATLKTFDSAMLSYFPGLVAWFSVAHTKQFADDLHAYFSGEESRKWSLEFWEAALALVLYTFLCDEELYPDLPIPYDAVLSAVRKSVDAGAIEFLLALAQDVRGQEGSAYFEKYRALVRSRVPSLQAWLPEPSSLSLQNLQGSMELVVVGFITNLADILKEMRLSEEDMYLAMNELEEDPQAVSPGEDLERFFLLVATIYRDRPESIEPFFSDSGNALYGFLVWGSECQASFMSATFTEVLSSLASGEQNSLHVHKFLLDAEKRQNQADETFLLGWRSMYDVFDYYIRELNTPQSGSTTTMTVTPHGPNGMQVVLPGIMALPPVQNAPPSQARNALQSPSTASVLGTVTPSEQQQQPLGDAHNAPAPYSAPDQSVQWRFHDGAPLAPLPTASQSQLSDDTLLVLSAYLGLVGRVAGQCAEAREHIRKGSNVEEGSRDFSLLLFRLLRVQQSLSASIFDALKPFARRDMWQHLDAHVTGRFEDVLTSVTEVLSFVQLLVSLVRDGGVETNHLPEYVEFVSHNVLVWAASVKRRSNVDILLQFQCLVFIKELMSAAPNGDIAFKACFQTKVYEAIFAIVSIGVDEVINLNAEHPLVATIACAVELIGILIRNGKLPAWSFNRPVLYNLHIIPHLALYAGTRFEKLSLASIDVLSLLGQSAEFRPTISRQSRILTILSSTSEATRIRVGLMARLQDPFTSHVVKEVLLELLVREFEQEGSPWPVMTAAHYLLGFRQSDLGLELKLELDKGVGGIASGNSMFGVICDLLLGCLAGELGSTRLLKLSSQLIGHLTRDSLTSDMVLDYLRPLQFILTTLSLEPVNPSASNFEDFFEHRAIMLNIWTSEVCTCQQKVYLTLENHYLERLEPIVFKLLDFMRFPRISVTLRCLKAWCSLIPVLINSGNSRTGPSFVLRAIQTLIPLLVEFSRETPTFAQPIASLLVSLLREYESSGVDAVVVNRMQPLLEASLLAIQPSKMNTDLRTDLYALCFNHFRMALQTQMRDCMATSLESVTVCGPRLLQIICDDALGSPSETLRLSAVSLLQVSAVLARTLNSEYLVDVFVQTNFSALLVTQVLRPPQGADGDVTSPRYSKVALSLLLQLGQSKTGAFDILHTKLFSLLENSFSYLKDDQLVLVIQLLIALILSTGADNKVVINKVRELLEKNRYVVDGVLKRESSTDHTLQNQDEESSVSQLARHAALLANLTMTPS